MAYFLDLFSPETYEAFTRSPRNISGFRSRQRGMAGRVQPGDKLVCYLTKLSRWIGILDVVSGPFEDDSPIFYPESDPFTVRFAVRPEIWLPVERACRSTRIESGTLLPSQRDSTRVPQLGLVRSAAA